MLHVFVDTAPLIYWLERRQGFHDAVERQLAAWVSQGAAFHTSVVTLFELCAHPSAAGREEDLSRKLASVLDSELITIDQPVAMAAAALRRRHGLKPLDALQIAAARSAGCTMFYTNDKRLAKVAGIAVTTAG